MDFTWAEIDQMAHILEAEIEGRTFDPPAARSLALRVAALCPDIGASMNRVAIRMTEYVEVPK
jgi:hypothetical protein